MPQINDVESFKAHLKSVGVEWKEFQTNPVNLRPTQVDHDVEKVQRIINGTGDAIPSIIVAKSGDGEAFVLDGHHRYHAAKEMGVDIPVVQMNLDIAKALRVAYAYNQATNDDNR